VYTLGSVHITVMCVIKHSRNFNIGRYMNVYILGSVHISVMFVIKHSVTKNP